MKKINLLVLMAIASFTSMAQNEDNEYNLVINPSFEEVDGKLRGSGQIMLAEPWKSMTMNPVDLYSADAKDDNFGVPENKYGKEKAKTGENYAGVSFFGYKGRLPRTYLGTQLKEPLKAGKQYCLKFHVSMSDMSKYAVNNLGMYITKDSLEDMSDGNLSFEPQIQNYSNKIFEKQFLWESICGVYKAEGGEQFIIIGNFASDEETQQETIRLSREFSGRQMYDAYYFIDDVSVIPTDKIEKKDCSCDQIVGGQMEVEYKTFGTDDKEKPASKKTYILNSDGSKAEESIKKSGEKAAAAAKAGEATGTSKEAVWKIDKQVIYFDKGEYEPKAAEEEKIDKIAQYLQDNPAVKISIQGHIDKSESGVKILGKRRGFYLEKALRDRGVNPSQIEYFSVEANQPISETDPSKNQRATISLQ